MRKLNLSLFAVLALLVVCPSLGSAQNSGAGVPTTEISADLGPCFAQITVTDGDGKPVYGAKISTRIQYGPLGVKRLDLEAFTGVDGRVKLTRLPETLKKPMFIHISKGDKGDTLEFKPNTQCHATLDSQLR